MKNKRGQNRSFSLCNSFPKNRRGSHVGIILSFVIFITFLVFLYTVLKPALSTGEDKKSVIQYIQREIIENTSSNLTSVSISIDEDGNPSTSCVKFIGFLITPEMNPPTIIVKNEKEVEQGGYSSYTRAGSGTDLIIERTDKDNTFFKAYSSPEFGVLPPTDQTCTALTDDKYTIGSIKTAEYVFEDRLTNLLNEYKTDYESLKTTLNIPPGSEFGLTFTKSDGEKISVGEPSSSANVYTEEIPIQYVNEHATILSGFINVKVW